MSMCDWSFVIINASRIRVCVFKCVKKIHTFWLHWIIILLHLMCNQPNKKKLLRIIIPIIIISNFKRLITCWTITKRLKIKTKQDKNWHWKISDHFTIKYRYLNQSKLIVEVRFLTLIGSSVRIFWKVNTSDSIWANQKLQP